MKPLCLNYPRQTTESELKRRKTQIKVKQVTLHYTIVSIYQTENEVFYMVVSILPSIFWRQQIS